MSRSAKRRKKGFKAGRHAFHVMDKLAPVLLADPLVKDPVLDAALLDSSTEDALFSGLKPSEVTAVRKKTFHGDSQDLVTRLRTYLRDLLSAKHAAECHGLCDTDGCRVVDTWMTTRVSAAARCGSILDCRNLIGGHPYGPDVEST